MYDNSQDSVTGHFPFVIVPPDREMPHLVYIFESRETGETETMPDGEIFPVMQFDMHQYADMSRLKNNLDAETFDKVRNALGLEALHAAVEKGEKILNDGKNLSDEG